MDSVILRTNSDWDDWIRKIELKASEQEVWQYIDPAKKESELPKLESPNAPDIRDIESLDKPEGKFQYEALVRDWNEKRDSYKAKKSALTKIRTYIGQSIALEHRYVLDNQNPYQILVELQDKLKPANWEAEFQAREDWQKLLKGWSKRTKLDDWLNQWSIAYREVKRVDLAEYPEDRMITEFLLTIRSIDPIFPRIVDSEQRQSSKKQPFEQIVNRFREDRRKVANHPLYKDQWEGFPTFRGQSDDPIKPARTEQPSKSGKKKPCVCGNPWHPVWKCWFINEDLRPEGWEPRKEKLDKVNKAIEKDPELQKIRDQHRRKTPASNQNQEPKSSPEAYFVTPNMGNEVKTYLAEDQKHPFQESVILDSGSTGHIINQRDRFVEFIPTPDDIEYTLGGVGTNGPRIHGTGKAWISVQIPNQEGRKKQIVLADAAYVPECLLSMVSVKNLQKKGIIWDMEKQTIRFNSQNGGRDLFRVIPTDTHYLLEDNRPNQAKAMAARGVKISAQPKESAATRAIWHRRMGHPGHRTIEDLPKAANHIRILDQNQNESEPCEDCQLAIAPKQISRRPMDRGSRPWQIIHFDIVPMHLSWDGYHTCFLHLYCPFTHYHEVRLMDNKGQVTREIRSFHQLLQNKGFRPEAYHTDGERSLGDDFENHLRESGMQIRQSAPYTQDQNGMAERAGGVILQVTRSIRLAARLPSDLWTFAVEHAAYLLNRRPVRNLENMTPYQKIFGQKPDLGHLRIFGCRAYRKLPNIPKLDKLEPRAEPGYFLGYQASNIFKIWHPETRKVAVSRDVTFNENLFFDSNQPIRLVQSAAELEEKSAGDLAIHKLAPHSEPFQDEDVIQRQNRVIFENARRLQEAGSQPQARNESERRDEAIQGQQMEDEGRQQGGQEEKMIWESSYPTPSPNREIPDESSAESSPNQEIRAIELDLPTPTQPDPQSYTPPESPPPVTNSDLQPLQPSNSPENQPQIQQEDPEVERQQVRLETRETRDQEVSQQREEHHLQQRQQEQQTIRQDQLRAEQFQGIHRPAPQLPAPRANEVSSDLNPDLILSAPRSRKRKEAYQATLDSLPSLPGYFSAFAYGLLHKPEDWEEDEHLWHRSDLPKPPKTWAQMNRLPEPHRTGFIEASRLEFDNITQMGTWGSVPEQQQDHSHEPLPLKWVWSYKFDSQGNLEKYKARICVRGDLQDISFQDTYAATLSARVIRCLLALAAVYGYRTNQRDMVNAFLNSDLDHPVYVQYPEGFGGQNRYLKLFKALYGLRQAPRLWQKELAGTLISMGLQQSSEELCLFQNQYLIFFFFVDDVVTLYKPEHEGFYQAFWADLGRKYKARDMGQISWFLGMRVIWDLPQQAVYLCQDSYIDKVAHRFHLTSSKSINTPLPAKKLIANNQTNQPNKGFIHLYQQKVGSVLYAALITRPDIAYAATKLSCFMINPNQDHMEAVDRVIQYLFSTRFLAIRFSQSDNQNHAFTAASDAAFADNHDRKSSEGYLFKLYGGPINWVAKKQKTVTTSTTEAELLSLSEATKHLLWWHRFFNDICFEGASSTIDCDNRQTVRAIIQDEAIQTRLRHMDIRNHWIRQEHQAGRVQINWIPTDSMPADGLTKPLNSEQHARFIQQLGLVNSAHLIG